MGSIGRILQGISLTVGSGNTVVMVTVDTVVINIMCEAKTSRCTVTSGNTVVIVTVDTVVINIVFEAYSNYTTVVFGVQKFSMSPRDAPVRGGRVTSLSIGK